MYTIRITNAKTGEFIAKISYQDLASVTKALAIFCGWFEEHKAHAKAEITYKKISY